MPALRGSIGRRRTDSGGSNEQGTGNGRRGGSRIYETIAVTDSASYDVPLPEVLGRACRLDDLASFDPHDHTFELIAAQRQREQELIAPGYDQTVRHRIGGEAQLTEVTRHGYKIWNCGSFNDRVGERIAVQGWGAERFCTDTVK